MATFYPAAILGQSVAATVFPRIFCRMRLFILATLYPVTPALWWMKSMVVYVQEHHHLHMIWWY